MFRRPERLIAGADEMPDERRPVIAEARIRALRSSDFAPVIAVIDEWWGGRPMTRMLPRLFFDHFTDTSSVLTSPF